MLLFLVGTIAAAAVAKVNDANGNPIEIAAVVVWQVQDTAQASAASRLRSG